MALKSQSLFLYNFKITEQNSSLDFKIVSGGVPVLATLTLGYYNLSLLLAEIVRALQAADPLHTYIATADRTTSGGTQNRVTISSSGTYFNLLFATGPRLSTSVSALIGFAATDRTGSLSYTGTLTAGVALIPDYIGYNYIPPQAFKKIFGSVNVSASGSKEAVVFNIQQFLQVDFKHEPEAKMLTEWNDLWDWLIQQRPFEFTPEITTPNTYYQVTLESTQEDGKGLGYRMTEQLPDFPFRYMTGQMKFRIRNV